MSKRILFVDDDRYFARIYKEALDTLFEVITVYDAVTAVETFRSDPEIVGAVIDVMMPPPPGCEAECHDGNTTGIWIISQCRDIIVKERIALLLFTNLGVAHVKDEIRFLALDPRISDVNSKVLTPSIELPRRLDALITRR